MNYENIVLHKRLNCARAKTPSIAHCMFDILTATCGSFFQMSRKNKFGLEAEQDGVTNFICKDKEISFTLNDSTGGVIEVGRKCQCSLCLFDPSWFVCHCSKCLPSHAFSHIPDRRHCPYVHIKPSDDFRTYINGRLLKNGWTYQLEKLEEKCCCIFHTCPNATNKEPCLCKKCVLDYHCDCTTCGGQCGECGNPCDVNLARGEIECKHQKCDHFSADDFWDEIKKQSPPRSTEQ